MTTPPPNHLTPRVVADLLLDTTPWLSCEECFERLDTHVEAALSGGPSDVAMERHLLGCPACAEEAASLTQLLRQDLPDADPPRED
jgi:hypothetical protein